MFTRRETRTRRKLVFGAVTDLNSRFLDLWILTLAITLDGRKPEAGRKEQR